MQIFRTKCCRARKFQAFFSPNAKGKGRNILFFAVLPLYRWAALLPVFLCGWGRGPVSVLRLLAAADLTRQSVVWHLQFSQITDKDEVTSHPVLLKHGWCCLPSAEISAQQKTTGYEMDRYFSLSRIGWALIPNTCSQCHSFSFLFLIFF